MTENPPQPGLTRAKTGYPHPLFPDWYITAEEVEAIEQRANATPEPLAQIQPHGTEVVCKTCRKTFMTGMPQQMRRCPACRATTGQAKRPKTA